MKVIGIDPAPGNPSHVFTDGGYREPMPAEQLAGFLDKERKKHDALLVCWDAPLTGPADPDGAFIEGDHTYRPIEKFFSQQKGRKAPKGISVLPYCGCPHWTISRRLLGLPRLGPWGARLSELPFQLVAEDQAPTGPGHYITEVHPAVALWLWVQQPPEGAERTSWSYKKDDRVLDECWQLLQRRLRAAGLLDEVDDAGFSPSDDDQLDAFVAWALGKLWTRSESRDVILLGSRTSGSFLLPRIKDLQKDFSAFNS